MANITIKNIPDEVYEQLKERAKRNRRSINNEVIHLIESQFRANQINVEEVLYKARKLRSKMKGSLTEEEIRQAINRDRDDSI
ncbi:MAG: Arc family DNA-binding protein [Balneolaceae bacterium]|nr:Arc family DNA-binding protein [Balneolaceae bacterium]